MKDSSSGKDVANPGDVQIALIGNPIGHSLSPAMHNALYASLGESNWHFAGWHYAPVECANEEEALKQIELVRTGLYRGMNITMPYKRLACAQADYVDGAADAAGGANVLVRRNEKLYAYNTDGLGAMGAIAREGGIDPRGKHVIICGTGPTSVAIACALAEAPAREVILFSRDYDRASSTIDRLQLSLSETGKRCLLRAATYDIASRFISGADIIVDATPRGMNAGDEAIIDTGLLHPGQVMLDTVYAHGVTALIGGARDAGAIALDGLEMLVEQAALSVEIWIDALGLSATVDRDIMRKAAVEELARRAGECAEG